MSSVNWCCDFYPFLTRGGKMLYFPTFRIHTNCTFACLLLPEDWTLCKTKTNKNGLFLAIHVAVKVEQWGSLVISTTHPMQPLADLNSRVGLIRQVSFLLFYQFWCFFSKGGRRVNMDVRIFLAASLSPRFKSRVFFSGCSNNTIFATQQTLWITFDWISWAIQTNEQTRTLVLRQEQNGIEIELVLFVVVVVRLYVKERVIFYINCFGLIRERE